MKAHYTMLVLVCFAAAALADGSETISVSPAPDGKSTQLTSPAGTLVVPLLEVQALAVLKSPSGVPSVLLSGRSCTECDENRSLYLVPLAYRDGKLLRYDYPGKLIDRDNGKTVQRVRGFYGDCAGTAKDSVVLMLSFKGADGHWHRTNSVLYPSDIPGQLENPLELKATRAAIEQRVKAGACHELPGLTQRSEP
jgi:hypothetical protein